MLIKVLSIAEKPWIQSEYLPVNNFLNNLVTYIHTVEYYNRKCYKYVYVCVCVCMYCTSY